MKCKNNGSEIDDWEILIRFSAKGVSCPFNVNFFNRKSKRKRMTAENALKNPASTARL